MVAVRALRGPLGPAGSPVATIDGGMGRLVERLHARLSELGAQVHTGALVTALRHDGTWHVTTSGTGADDRTRVEVDADVLCLAVPALVAARLLGTLEGPESASLVASLMGLPTTHDVLLVSLLVEDAALTRAVAPLGSGVLVADDTVTAKAMTHASAKWGWLADRLPPEHHVVRLSYGGTHELPGPTGATGAAGADAALGDTALVAGARADVQGLLAAAGVSTDGVEVRASQVTRWHAALSRPVVGRSAMLDAIDVQLARLPRLALTGSALGGNGLAGVVARSALEARRTL
jgi:oxygen-dependent protoporphyrinogen oxidase